MLIPFHKAHITEDEILEVTDTLRSSWITMGPKTVLFEDAFKLFIGSEYAVSVNSATASLHLALKAIGLQSGDEVIIPTHTFIATAEVVTYFGAIPVLCDAEEMTHNLDVAQLQTLLSPRTKAIIPVHFAGIPCDMDEILSIGRAHGISIIEDAAHALPARYKGRAVGTMGDATCFSFYATKTLACGEGGMLTTSNSDIAKHAKINRLHGISMDAWDRYTAAGTWHYDVVDNGFKYNMTDINAALGLVQLKKVIWMRDERKKISEQYDAAFKKHGIQVLCIPEYVESAYHLYIIKVKNRDFLYQKLKELGITTSVHFIPVHRHSYYCKTYRYESKNYPVSERVFEQSLSLPIYPGMTEEMVSYVIQHVLLYAI